MPRPGAELVSVEAQGTLAELLALLRANTPQQITPEWLVEHQWPALSVGQMRQALRDSGLGLYGKGTRERKGGRGNKLWVRRQDLPLLDAYLWEHVLPGALEARGRLPAARSKAEVQQRRREYRRRVREEVLGAEA